jgi:hypothetical protein
MSGALILDKLSVDQSVENLGGLWMIAKLEDGKFIGISWSNNSTEAIISLGGNLFEPIKCTNAESLNKIVKNYKISSYKTFANQSSMDAEWSPINKMVGQARDDYGMAIRTATSIGVGLLFAGIAYAVTSRDGKEPNKLAVGASGLAGFIAHNQYRRFLGMIFS